MSEKAEETQEKQENQVADQQPENHTESHKGATGGENEINEVEKLQAEVQDANDRYTRLYSEFENFRRRTAKEKLELIGSASADLMKDILPVLDDLDRALENQGKNDDGLTEGLSLVQQKFKGILKNKGLEEIDAMGKPFDIEFHEAVTKIPAPSKKEKGCIVDVIEKGYMLNEKIIRYAKVVVGE
jgi:molecular chaperone GrpE